MKTGKRKTQSINTELMRLLLVSFLISIAAFAVLNVGINHAVDYYFENSTFIENRNGLTITDLQNYVDKNQIASNDEKKLNKWMKKSDVRLLQVFKDDKLRYDSEYSTNGEEWYLTPENYYKWEAYYEVTFSDGAADVFLLGVSPSQYYHYVLIGSLIVSFLLFIMLVMAGIQKMIRYIQTLSREIAILEAGDLDYAITIQGKNELSDLANGLEEMRKSFKQQLEKESYLTKSHTKLVTEMSHDLRTPLTSLLMYSEIVKSHKYKTPEQAELYIKKIDKKAHQIKRMIDNIFNYSLNHADTSVALEQPQQVQAVFYDLLSDLTGYLQNKGFHVITNLSCPDVAISVNTDYLLRVMDNITSNLIKYAEPAAPVRVSFYNYDGYTGIIVQNVIKTKNVTEDGTHIGIENMKQLMTAMNGQCHVVKSESIYTIEILFKHM